MAIDRSFGSRKSNHNEQVNFFLEKPPLDNAQEKNCFPIFRVSMAIYLPRHLPVGSSSKGLL